MGRFEKLTTEQKEYAKKQICEFIDQLDESDELIIGGKSEVDIFTGQGKKTMWLNAEKKS